MESGSQNGTKLIFVIYVKYKTKILSTIIFLFWLIRCFQNYVKNRTISRRPIVMFHYHFASLPAYHAVQERLDQRITPAITRGNFPEKAGGHRAACLSGVMISLLV
ncbi:hypothetical protein ACET85_11760 [Aeromonas veronii]|uniref:hypothetical protein n=1 Tax=Aeromonas veronii TaxID=654 RepID=UPI0027DCBD11|nr:hypothetical protein [Aeromonas veronii]EKP0310744.1 hypothetical protein [Aeromonas veronii]WMJ04626.1 hypothetical protein RBH93_18915 [Aeromonas veronii]